MELFEKNSKALFIPEFNSNLISVNKATNDLDCLFVFSPKDVQFQNIESGKTIGDGSTQ